MTGEVDLIGRVLPVGNLASKIRLAYEHGCSLVVAPFTDAEMLLADARAGGTRLPLPELRASRWNLCVL